MFPHPDIEALWENLSPDPGCATTSDLQGPVQAVCGGAGRIHRLGQLPRRLEAQDQEAHPGQRHPGGARALLLGVDFHVATLERFKSEEGPDEGKVYNLLRGLQKEMLEDPAGAVVLHSHHGTG